MTGVLPVDPARLVIEVTESSVIDAGDRLVRDVLQELRSLGAPIAIDDFGTGYSSLSYLWDLPADSLKIDKSFTDRVADSDRMAALVAGIVAIADTLGLATVAEAVETLEQRDVLQGIGCRFGQGYLFSRPVPPADALALARLAEPSQTVTHR